MSSGGVFNVGSVLSVTPVEPGKWSVQFANAPGVMPAPVVGWAIVVSARDMWVMNTRVLPMVICCGVTTVFAGDENHTHGDYHVVKDFLP